MMAIRKLKNLKIEKLEATQLRNGVTSLAFDFLKVIEKFGNGKMGKLDVQFCNFVIFPFSNSSRMSHV